MGKDKGFVDDEGNVWYDGADFAYRVKMMNALPKLTEEQEEKKHQTLEGDIAALETRTAKIEERVDTMKGLITDYMQQSMDALQATYNKFDEQVQDFIQKLGKLALRVEHLQMRQK